MYKLLATALLLGFWLIPVNIVAQTPSPAQPRVLHLVQKIYIGDIGTSEEAVRFRLLLEDKLSQKGFTVVTQPENADAILSGALSVSTVGFYGGVSDINVTARLISNSGERLWSINLPKPVTFKSAFRVTGLKIKEPAEYRAEELARNLRADWEKSAKASGMRVKR